MTLNTLNGEAARFASAADLERLRPDLERLVTQAVDAVRACAAKPDDTFGSWGELVAAIRSTAFHEGLLLERGVARLALCNPDLIVVPMDRPMPIVPAAREILRRNNGPLPGIRLSSEVHARETYAPDLVIVDKVRHTALILDVKRSLVSYETRRLNDLRSRMMAAAMIAGDWLSIECRTPPVGDVSVAIIDGSDEAIDHDRGVWGLSEIGDLLEIEGAAEAMAMLRHRFGEEVRSIFTERCRTVLLRELDARERQDGRGSKQSPADRSRREGRVGHEQNCELMSHGQAGASGRSRQDLTADHGERGQLARHRTDLRDRVAAGSTQQVSCAAPGSASDNAALMKLLKRLDPDRVADDPDESDEEIADADDIPPGGDQRTARPHRGAAVRSHVGTVARIGFARSRTIQ